MRTKMKGGFMTKPKKKTAARKRGRDQGETWDVCEVPGYYYRETPKGSVLTREPEAWRKLRRACK
jgi:hypothetical protein